MRAFNYSLYKEQLWDGEILNLIAGIYKERGKEELFLKEDPICLERLVEIAKIQSTQSSNAIEGIYSTSTRIRQLVENKTSPKNRSESEIAGYRDALNVIHESHNFIKITKNYILQLHKILFSHLNNPMGGKLKNVQNYISVCYKDGREETLFTPLAPFETEEALDKICFEYNLVIGNFMLEPLLIIPIFIHDFLCIHPFNDGNGRLSRLLTTLLLYQNSFSVAKYISLEAKIEKTKDLYYESLQKSQIDWHNGKENKTPFIKYLLSSVLSAYKDFSLRAELVDEKLSAFELVKKVVEKKIGYFKKDELRQLLPSLSDSSIELALRKLLESGKLRREGKGKSTTYVYIGEGA